MKIQNESLRFYERLASERNDDPDLRRCVEQCIKELNSTGTEFKRPGMLLGKIQSGKTRAFLGVIALGFDEGFEVAIVLTKGTKTLAKQTVQRISDDYKSFRTQDAIQIYDIMSVPALSEWEVQSHKLVFVVKKESRNLDRLRVLFTQTQPLLTSRKTLIVDDEADFAGVRFQKQKNTDAIEQGKIADQLDALRRLLTSFAYLQVTATPYSLYLQPENYDLPASSDFSFEPKRPAFTVLLPTHKDYVGGDSYFGDQASDNVGYYFWVPIAEEELGALKKEDRRRLKVGDALESRSIQTLRRAIMTFVVGAVIRRLQDEQAGKSPKKYSLVMHVETSRSAHEWQEQVVREIIQETKSAIESELPIVRAFIDDALADLKKSISTTALEIPDFLVIERGFRKAFTAGGIIIERVNSDNDIEALLDEKAELKLRTPYNIFIGGQILDRGITVPNLIGFYYGRSPKKMQQDTVLQHSRMYGARPHEDLAVTRFDLPLRFSSTGI